MAAFRTILILSAFTYLLYACRRDKVRLNVQTNGNITLIDSEKLVYAKPLYFKNFRYGYYPIYYLGPMADTVRLIKNQISKHSHGQKEYENDSIHFNLIDTDSFQIFVDTTMQFTYRCEVFNPYEKSKVPLFDGTGYNTYALLLTNNSKSYFYLGHFNNVGFTVRQAQNQNGEWIDIEHPIQYQCGTGARDIVLESNWIAVSKMIRYKGNYRTACRLKFQARRYTTYSNTFYDYIDERQLTDSLPDY